MGYLADSYRDLSPLKTDLYQITMSQAYFDEGRQDEQASFYMHWRKPPFGGSYTVAAGLEGVVDFLKHFTFDDEKIKYLKSIKKEGQRLFSDEFLEYLKHTKLALDIDAVPEGTVMTGPGPVIRVSGPLVQCQLVESAILNIINSSSMVATRAVRIDEASDGKAVFADNSLRRSPTLDTSPPRSSYIGGAKSTADADAAMRLGIPVVGTMAHSFIMGYRKSGVPTIQTELQAFKSYLKSMPTNSVLLVDTYDTEQGIKNAIIAAKETGVKLNGVRMDSGDLFQLTWRAKELIDEAKAERPDLFNNTKIYLTNDLDELKIKEFYTRSLEEKGKPFPDNVVYGVGTALGNPGPLGGVYKISACEPAIEVKKLDDGATVLVRTMKVAGRDPLDPNLPGPKSSLPGLALDTLRLKDEKGDFLADVIIDRAHDEDGKPSVINQGYAINMIDNRSEMPLPANVASSETLLKSIFKAGEYVYPAHGAPGTREAYEDGPLVTNLDEIQAYCKEQRAHLPRQVRDLLQPTRFPLMLDPRINEERRRILTETTEIPQPPLTRSIDMYIDNQYGFCDPTMTLQQGGSLYVPEGEMISAKIGKMVESTRDGIIVLSQDFHPADHISFMSNHRGVMEYRKALLAAQGKSTEDVMNPLVLPFSEIVLDRNGLIIGVKDGDKVRKVELESRSGQTIEQGWHANAQDKGRITKVLDEWLPEPFESIKNATTQMLWPPHCIQGTKSAQFNAEMHFPEALTQLLETDQKSPDLRYEDPKTGNIFYVVRKGMNPELDSYGIGIENDKMTETTAPRIFKEIALDLRGQDVQQADINIGGLATNFCVEFSHNNVCDQLVPALRMRGIEPNINLLTDVSRGIPIPGGADDPFSLQGAPERMVRYSGGRTKATYAEAVMKRRPDPTVYGGVVNGDQEQQVQRA